MPRLARIVAVDEPHHITQRGNNQQDIFFVDDDRKAYLTFLRDYCTRYRFKIHAYCLMTNHVHVVGIPEKEDSLAKAIGQTHFRYTQYINQRHGWSGHLWQGRFHSCILDGDHYGNALRYVEQNPVRAKMNRRAWCYPWSSAGVHGGVKPDDGLLDLTRWREEFGGAARWKKILTQHTEIEFQEALRLKTRTGRPLGSDNFLSHLETTLGRRVRPLPVGRPRGAKTKQKEKRRGKGRK